MIDFFKYKYFLRATGDIFDTIYFIIYFIIVVKTCKGIFITYQAATPQRIWVKFETEATYPG